MITPWYIGDTYPLWLIQLIPDSGAFSVAGLTIGSFSILFRSQDTGVEVTGTGTFSSITAAITKTVGSATIVTAPASVKYAVASSDVSAAGQYQVLLRVSFLGGGIETLNLGNWQVIPS